MAYNFDKHDPIVEMIVFGNFWAQFLIIIHVGYTQNIDLSSNNVIVRVVSPIIGKYSFSKFADPSKPNFTAHFHVSINILNNNNSFRNRYMFKAQRPPLGQLKL